MKHAEELSNGMAGGNEGQEGGELRDNGRWVREQQVVRDQAIGGMNDRYVEGQTTPWEMWERATCEGLSTTVVKGAMNNSVQRAH